ncbi:MAG: response regulator transcription factor [Faecalibacterium sp.]|nr:response regulator transcription factor [Faecalibacterium sp.]
MFPIAICDDSPVARAELKRYLQRYWDDRGQQVRIREFAGGEELLRGIPAETRIVFLDIEMPGLSGIETARALRERYPALCIFFVTAFTQYAIEGYSVHAYAYLKKPVKYGQLCQQLDDALTTLQRERPHFITMRRGSSTVLLNSRDIQSIEVKRHTLIVSYATEKESFAMNLNDVLPQLEGHGFSQCHRSYVVNLAHLSRITATDLVMQNGELIPLSKYRRKAFLEEYAQYKGGIV